MAKVEAKVKTEIEVKIEVEIEGFNLRQNTSPRLGISKRLRLMKEVENNRVG